MNNATCFLSKQKRHICSSETGGVNPIDHMRDALILG